MYFWKVCTQSKPLYIKEFIIRVSHYTGPIFVIKVHLVIIENTVFILHHNLFCKVRSLLNIMGKFAYKITCAFFCVLMMLFHMIILRKWCKCGYDFLRQHTFHRFPDGHFFQFQHEKQALCNCYLVLLLS